MLKDTKSLGNNKAPACESRGFVHKKRGVHFDTPPLHGVSFKPSPLLYNEFVGIHSRHILLDDCFQLLLHRLLRRDFTQ